MSISLASLLLQAAAASAGGQDFPSSTLYVVATPIGNLADLTLRAIHVLSLVDAVACEDTRHSAALLQHLGLHKPLLTVHEHNEREASQGVVERLQRGERIAYVSDAGTPAVSDPGTILVATARAAGLRCMPIPGVSSAMAAISVAGSEASSSTHGGFVFHGFLSHRAGDRARQLAAIAAQPQAHVLFEAPHRINELAQAMAAECAGRAITVCRELTKQFETVASMPAADLPSWLNADNNRQRGEFALVLHAIDETAAVDTQVQHDDMLRTLLAELPLKQAVGLASKITQAPRNQLYARALALKKETGRSTDND